MSASTYRVRLTGTWHRRNTSGGDINYVRKLFRAHGVKFSVSRDQRGPGGRLHRVGRFNAVINIPRMPGLYLYPDVEQQVKAATHQLKGLAVLICCSPPTIKVESGRSDGVVYE